MSQWVSNVAPIKLLSNLRRPHVRIPDNEGRVSDAHPMLLPDLEDECYSFLWIFLVDLLMYGFNGISQYLHDARCQCTSLLSLVVLGANGF